MANKKKKQNTHASGSGSIISNYFESQDKLYERDMQGQKIASETRAKADSYYGEDKKYSDTDYTNQSESRYRRLAEKAVEIKERTQKNSEKYKRTNTLIRNAAKAENNMLSEIPRREQREKQEQQRRKQRELEEKKEKELEKRKNQKFYTSTGNKYKDPSLMGYDELQRTLANVKENKDLFKSRIADSGLFKRGFSGEWEKVQPKDFEEKLGKKGVSWEDYKEYTSLWNKYQDNVEYMKELESNQPRVELEHEYDKLGDTDKQLVKKAADYVWVEKRKYSADKNHLVPTIQDKLEVSSNPDYLSQAYEKFPKLKELKEKGIDVDYIIDSENINTDNKEQEAWDEGTRKIADEHPVVSSALSVGSNLLSPLELAEDVNHAVKNLSSDKSYPINHASHPYSSYTNNVRQTVSEGIDNDIGKFVYNAGMSTVDSAADILVTKGVKGTKLAGGAASALMGANAANQSYMDTYERTGSAGQSLITGLGAGLAEWASEKFSLDSFEALKTTNPKQFRDFAKNLVKQGAVEGSEELASDFANAFVDRAVNGSKSEYNENVKNYIQQGMSKDEAKKNARKDFLIQVAEDTAAGAFSGGLFGTYANVYSKAQYESLVKKNGTSITEGNEGTDLLAYAAKRGMDTYEKAKDDTEKYGKISVDIMENAENNFTEARTSGELARAYEDAIRGVPDSLGVEIDQMAREKAQELAKKSKYAKFESERQALYDIMDASVSNAMKRTVSLNQKSEMMQKESVSKQEEDATANIDTTFDRVNLDEGMERNQRPVEVQELQPEKTKQNDAPSENVTNANFRKTENAAFTASDEQVKVKGFREIGKESATVETTDGEVVNLADLSFQDEGTQNLFNIASKMDNAAAATALVDYYNGKDNAGVYANNFRMAYRMGRLGSISFDKMMQASKSFRIMSDKGAMRLAYELGKVHGENAKAAEAENKVAPAQKKGKGEYEDYRYASEDKDSFVRMKKELAKKTGLDVLDLNTLTDKDADTVNGLLNMDRGQMAFAEDAENKFGVVIHESLEFASVMSEKEYQKLMGVMLNYLVEKHGAEDIHALIESYQRAYEQVEGEKSYEDAAGELINDAVSGVFYDEAGAKNFIDWVMKDAKLDVNAKKNVFQKIADLVKHVFEKIKKYIDDTPMTKAARLAAELNVEQKEKIQQMFMDAVDKAGENYKKLDSNNKGEEKEKRGKYSVKVIPDTIQDDIKTNLKDVANMPTVSNVKETEFSKGKIKLVDQVAEFFDDIGNNVYNEMLGDVELSRKGVKDDISHGIGRAKAISFKAIPDIIKNGKIVNYSSNYKGKGHARVVIAAPIEIVGSQEKICGKYIMAVVLRRENAKQRFYMHEVATIKRDELLFKTRTYNKVISNPSNNPSLEEILTNIVGNVKNKDSKMTNEKPTKENKDIRYSISVDLDKQIDDVLNDTVPKDYTHVYLGETTKALKELGWNDLPMLMTNQHVYSVINEKKDKGARYKKIRNYHNLGKEKFMQVLEDIERPWMIIKSNNKENNADLVMVSSVVDKNGNVVIAAVKPNGVGRKKTATLDANIMLSMYGKEALHNYVEKAGKENRIIKVNPDKAVGPTVQFRGNVLHQDYKDNLARYKKIVKNIISGEGEKYSLHVSERAENSREANSGENKDSRYSISVDLDKQIDDVLNDTVPKDYTHVYLGETTKALKELGWNDLPMLMTNQHVYSTIKTQEEAKKENRFKPKTNYHGLGKGLFTKLQKQLETPAMIIKSNTNENNADVILVTNVKDNQGNVVIAAIKPNGSGRVKGEHTIANVMLSLYGKKSIQNYVESARKENRIIKVNPDEAVWPMGQSHGGLLHQDYSNNLARYKEIVKNIISGEGEKYSLHVSERAEKLRHSLAETMTTEESLVEENEQLKKVVEMLQSEFKPGKKTIPEPARVEAVCKKILKKYHSSFDAETFRDNLTKLYAYMNEEGADYKEALKITSEIARGVLEKSTAKDMTLYNEYKDLREYFRKTKLALSEAQKSEVNYMYGSMGEFRKSNFGRLRIVSEGTTLDQVWGELSEKYPELFKADTNDGDMIAEVMTVLDGLRPTYRNAYGEDIEQASYDLALNIYKEMSMIPQRQTFKDKADAAVEREWKEANRVYLTMLQDYRKECEKQFLEGLKVSMNDQIKNKNQRIREAYAKIHDYANVIETTQNGELIRKYQHEIEKQKRYIERLKKGQDKKIAEMKIENRQYRKNLSEQKKQTEAKNKIRRLHKQMRQMLMKPKEGMYVPQDLVRSVIDVCEAVNLGAKEGTQLYNALDDARQYFEKMKNDPDYNFASEYDEDIDYELQRIANKFKNNGNSIYDLSSADLDEVYDAMKMVYKTIRRATELIRKEGETNARKAAERVIHEVRSAKGVSSFMSTHKVIRKFPEFTLKSLNSYRAFRRITGYADGEFMQEWRELNEGQRKMLKIQQDGEAILADVMEDENVVKLMKTFDKKQGMVDTGLVYEDGKKVQVTKGMRMALVMHGMNKDNLRHMVYGGVTMPNMDLYLKGDKKGAYNTTKKAVGVTSAKIQAMEDAMSPEEKKVLRAFKKLFHEYTGSVINETSMELYGFKKANEKNYYPISVDENYIATDITGLKMDKTLEGAGFLKERVQSTKPLVLESIIDTAQRSLKITSEFGGLAIPIRNFNKVYNGSTWKVTDVDSEDVSAKSVLVQDDTVHKAMQDVWGRMASNYIDNLISDLQNARTGESTVFDMLRGNFAGSVLTGNWSVIMKQAASYPTAVATLGWEPVMKALAKGGKHGLPISSADRELIAKYTPLLWYRNKGNSTQEMADIDNLNSLTNRMPVVKEVKNMIQKVDVATVGRIWYASQYYVDANYKSLKKGTDAYYRQVAEVFNRCVEDTQPNYTVMQRPDYLRDPSKIKKVMFMFMTQRMQNGGILYDAACNLHAKNQNGTKEQKKQARKEFAWAVSSQLVSAAVLSTMTFLARGLLHKVNPYRDDENELTTESVMSEWMNGVLGSLSGSFIGGNELYNLVYSAITKEKYYGIEVSLFSEISSLCESIVKMGNGVIDAFSDSDEEAENGKDAIKNAFFDAAGVVAKMCGIPVDNVKNVAVGIWKNVEDVTSGEGLFSFSTDKEEPKANVYGKKIYDALMDGDKKTAAQYREKMKQNGKKGEGDVETAVKDQLASRNDLVKQAAQYRLDKNHDGYMECYNKLIKMGFNHYEVVAATNSVLNKMQDKTESGAKDAHDYLSFYKSDDLVAAIEEGKGYEEILQQMYEEAMTKIEKDDEKHELSASKKEKKAFASIRSKLSSEYKDRFQSAKNTHEKQLIMQKLYKLKIKGKCIYTSDTFKKWNEE
ncbi:hypothetical protein [Clostridium sp. AF36-4]|jgi:hypothetical protein|uniref:MuF-C-terminal domain-containing protein n=1 Tax=Clostridium sp. AF36-4 TaxID=2293015 RepID=UPI000E3F8118|nr:hypothetical protein [Clostridium sp. AF36-4]RGF54545.1 hypothetical protein DW005_09440 [Clostridium sp. AF36-4]